MKKNSPFPGWLITFLLFILITSGIYGQSSRSMVTNTGNMTLSGTSTLHDWTMNGVFQVEGDFKTAGDPHKLQAISKLTFMLPVTNLKSDKKKLDETAYKALKTEEHKTILFTMTSASVKEIQSNKYTIMALGNLTIAGVTKPVTMQVNWVVNPDQTVSCTGVHKLKMTDFEVQPPRFLGVMKCGDDIELDFNFQFKS